MANENRDFKGVWIPKEVWLDKRLNALEKIILAEIDSLGSEERGCWASNIYIANFCQCSESKVTKSIAKLIELGYIYLQSFDGRQRELRSRLVNYDRQSSKIYEADSEKIPHSNIYNNTTNNQDINNIYCAPQAETPKTTKRFSPPTVEEVRAYCIERRNNVDAERFVDYYTANGWQVGKNKMRDWKAAVRTWERNRSSSRIIPTSNNSPDDGLDGIL